MKKYLFLIISIVLFFACEDKQEKDCADVEGGTALIDSCDVCVGGTTDVVACTQDCADVWGGNNICGCMDMAAINYDVTATFDNNSCEYLSFSYLAGTWNTSAACASSDPNGCDTCEEQPLYECVCGDGSYNCDDDTIEALSDEESCVAGGGNWRDGWFRFALYDDGTAGRAPECNCPEDGPCDGNSLDLIRDSESCVAAGGVWDIEEPEATYSIDGLNVFVTFPWGDAPAMPFSNNQLTLTVSNTPNCNCYNDDCDEDTVEALADAASCEGANGEWEEGFCVVHTLER